MGLDFLSLLRYKDQKFKHLDNWSNGVPTEILIGIALVVVLGIVVFIVKSNSSSNENPESKSSKEAKTQAKSEDEELFELVKNLPDNLRDIYELAMSPVRPVPVLYALVTCQHCIRTQKFLKENKVDCKVIHVDLFESIVRQSVMKKLKEYNPKGSFPTFIMPSGKTVVGFREHLLREAIQNEPK